MGRGRVRSERRVRMSFEELSKVRDDICCGCRFFLGFDFCCILVYEENVRRERKGGK